MDPTTVREAKLIRLAEAISDAESMKAESATLQLSVDDIRQLQADAVTEILDAGGSVAAVESVPLPSER